MSEALIPVRKAEIAIGKPLPWSVYDANHVLLLNEGMVVSSEFQLQTLMEKGMYREGGPHASDHRQPERAQEGVGAEVEDGTDIPFDRVRLSPGDLVQLKPMQTGTAERYDVRFIGALKGRSVLVTNPVVDDKVIFVREGQVFLVRAFAGVNVCAFRARVLKASLTPFPYLHLAYPTSVQAVRLRKAVRAAVDIIVAVHEREGGALIASGRIVDLSVGGARVQTSAPFGQKGGRVIVSFKVKLDEMEEIVTTQACVRSVGEERDEKGRPVYAVGIQFGEITPSQRLIIMNLVYQHLFKET